MLRQLAVLLLVALTATKAQTPYGPVCLDPPSNGPIAAVVVTVVEAFRPYFYTGVPALHIPILDPLGPLPPVAVHVVTSSADLTGSSSNAVIHNLGAFIICQMNITLGLQPKFDFIITNADLMMDGHYELNGHIKDTVPVAESGEYTIDAIDGGFEGSGQVAYSILHDRISVHNLEVDVFFDELHIVLSGASDALNGQLSDVAASLFRAVWDQAAPTISTALENAINDALYDVSISDLIPPQAQPMAVEGDYANLNIV